MDLNTKLVFFHVRLTVSLREKGVDLNDLVRLHMYGDKVSLREKGVDLNIFIGPADGTRADVSLREKGVDLNKI